jgi:LPS-assembly protein
VPRVNLPCELPGQVPLNGSSPAPLICQAPEQFNASDLVGNVSVTAYQNWSVNLDYVWNPYTYQTQKSEVSVQYRPDSAHIINVGYRFQHDVSEQWDTSFAWPIATHWNAVGRWVYSIMGKQVIEPITAHQSIQLIVGKQTIEQVAGLEYKSCCWSIQIVQRRYINNQYGALDTSYAIQLQLIGLGSVGKTSNAFLERSISGYSASDQAP